VELIKALWQLNIIGMDANYDNLNNLMRTHNRKILLLVDNAPTHVTNIRLYYLPPNTTALQCGDYSFFQNLVVINI